MKIISHRGNLNGRNPEQENHPSYIQAAIDAGYDVEVDVWYINGEYYLGHDQPQYRVHDSWLNEMSNFLWCHAKNDAALVEMLELGLNCFWHETDRFTLTSKSIPWCYPENFVCGGVAVLRNPSIKLPVSLDLYGVCTDHPSQYKV
jgi:hypothetical protein